MLDGYTLPMGLLTKPIKTEIIIIQKPRHFDSTHFDKLLLEHVVSKKMDWCINNKTCKNKTKQIKKKQTRKNIS